MSEACVDLLQQRAGEIRVYDTHVSTWEDHVDQTGMRRIYESVLSGMRTRGWRIERDPDAVKHYPSLAPWTHVGRKGDLELFIRTGGRCLEADFFQNVHRGPDSNPNGGRYDFGKFARLPRHMRLQCIAEMCAVIDFVRRWGHSLSSGLASAEPLGRAVLRIAERRLDEGDPLGAFNRGWGADRFDRGADGWPSLKEYKSWRCRDRDGIELLSGDVRCARVDGRLFEGTVHPGVNEQWIIQRNGVWHYCNPRAFFICDRPDKEPRRVVPGQMERLHRETEKALKAKSYRRATAVSAALARVSERSGMTIGGVLS